MIQQRKNHLLQSIEQELKLRDLDTVVDAETIASRIAGGVAQWQIELPDGSLLHLLRLHAPLVQREEVFLGNVLLNEFLFKALPRAAETLEVGWCSQVANDLDNAYFLAYGALDMETLRNAWVREIHTRLPELYVGDQDVEAGIHGNVGTMLTFYKSNIDPFPVFAIPRALLPDLLQAIIPWLRRLVDEDGAEVLADADNIPTDVAASRRINVILSHLSFFFCRDGIEMQSFHRFITNGMEDGRLSPDLICKAFGVSSPDGLDKRTFNRVKGSDDALDYTALRQAINTWLDTEEIRITEGEAKDVAPYLAGKMLSLSPEDVVEQLVAGAQLGYLAFAPSSNAAGTNAMACRFCGVNVAVITEKNIIGGLKSGGRFNQSMHRNADRFCVRCAVSSYLENKRLGMQFDSGGFPIPKLYNVVFHYGGHDDVGVAVLQQQIETVLDQAQEGKDLTEIRQALADVRREVEARMQPARTYDAPEDVEAAALAVLEEWDAPALDVAAQMQTDIQTDVLPLGAGSYRLLVFVLPQLRPGTQESMDFVQQRFSHSRLAAFTLLALLRGICGCDGPYYFQSLPSLTADAVQPDTFYVRNQSVNASEVLRKYGVVINFARQVTIYQRGRSPLAAWILLAEQLLDDPLSVFSDVLRRSPLRAGDDFADFTYRRLSNTFVPGMSVVDSIEYLQLFEMLKKLQREVS